MKNCTDAVKDSRVLDYVHMVISSNTLLMVKINKKLK